jgi:hypothetical protein
MLAVPDAQGQFGLRRKGSGGWGPANAYCQKFNTNTVETVSGRVISIEKFKPERGMSPGLHLQLKTNKEIVPVHLGPSWYIESQDTKIEAEDQVTVKGSRVTFDGSPAIIAAEVKRGEEILKLRDEHGFPAWAGWRRR